MEGVEDNTVEKRNSFLLSMLIPEHLTILDLSNKNFKYIDETVKLPINLTQLNLSNNKLSDVPVSVLNLENLKLLDLSHNSIKYFDDTPGFCHTIQWLSISNNDLNGPPYWIWTENPTNLIEVNLSGNPNITKSFYNGYFEELLGYKTPVVNIMVSNCKLKDHIELIGTFPNAKSLVVGTTDFSSYSLNDLEEVPCKGIDKCCDIEYLNLSNTNIYNVKSNIEMYHNLKEINLSHNKLDCLPEEFCLLENLEICILSYNRLYSLPANICKLSKITKLSADCNKLYTLPCNLRQLPNIQRLDMYNNYLYEVPDGIENLLEVDLAQNCFEEPNDEEYLEKRKIIRANTDFRCDGRRVEEELPESERSCSITDEDDLISRNDEQDIQTAQRCSSPEDWDSDDCWVPYFARTYAAVQSPWLYYVKKKIEEGNFCPIDAHVIPMADQITYERMRNPQVQYELEGQFDDVSSDDTR